ncbi:salivary peroxidase/catechol oxidase-like isoform X1 [Haemaphysalis longicornis]
MNHIIACRVRLLPVLVLLLLYGNSFARKNAWSASQSAEVSELRADEGSASSSSVPSTEKCPFARVDTSLLQTLSQGNNPASEATGDALRMTNASLACNLPLKCDPKKPFRELDGSCNNLAHPHWGMVNMCLRRELPAAYSDCVSSIRVSVTGRPLPSTRLVSTTVHYENRSVDPRFTNMAVLFGQFLTHDISHLTGVKLSALPIDLGPGPNPPCLQGDRCFPIPVPENDYFYGQYNTTLIGIKRTEPCVQCGRGVVDQMNQQTSYADLSLVYGHNENVSRATRKFEDGMMLSREIGGIEYLPDSLSPDEDNCSHPDEGALCAYAGDARVNQQKGILALATLWIREHNRIARKLAGINPHWDDEMLFQVTKRIQEGRYQHIVFAEWLPWQLGPKVMDDYDLRESDTGRTTYDETLDGTLSNEFTAAHFRYAHTNVDRDFWRVDEDGTQLNSIEVKDDYFRPLNDTYRPLDDVLRGSVQQPLKPFNRFGDNSVTRFTFHVPPTPFGGDLFAIDMQRGLDHGVRPYVDWVQHCRNITISDFSDLRQVIPEEVVALYEGLYEDARDIDYFSGAVSEPKIEGAQLGATFACGVARQFQYLKLADRFYYEHANQSGSFTDEQLATIKKTTLTKILCENVHGLDAAPVSRNAFLRPGNESEAVTCDELPDIDLSKWREEIDEKD